VTLSERLLDREDAIRDWLRKVPRDVIANLPKYYVHVLTKKYGFADLARGPELRTLHIMDATELASELGLPQASPVKRQADQALRYLMWLDLERRADRGNRIFPPELGFVMMAHPQRLA
jgi:hypothetical protein